MLDAEIEICKEKIKQTQDAAIAKFRQKISEETEKINFRKFVCTRVLNNTPEDRTIYLLGRIKDDPTDSKAVAILSKTEFSSDEMLGLGRGKSKKYVHNPAMKAEEYFHNSIFRKYWLQFSEMTSRVQCNFIYPATDMLVKKYSKQQMYTVRETADVYKRVTKALYLDSLDMSHCDWMYNVLDNKKEQDLTVFENEHFKLQKDFKFNEGDLSTLYLLAIPTTRTLKSVRCLSADHLPMLKSILAESYKVIETKFKVPSHKILALVHYLPTYWLLHVHFIHIEKQSRDTRDHIALEAVINNIEMKSDYY